MAELQPGMNASIIQGIVDEYVQTINVIDSASDVQKQGEITIDREGKLLISYLDHEGFTGDTIDAYNQWISNGLPKQIEARSVLIPAEKMSTSFDVFATFTNLHIIKPSTVGADRRSRKLLPNEARLRNLTYSAQVKADLIIKDVDGVKHAEKLKVDLGMIPVMLGSKLCHLHGMSNMELLEAGECITDSFGYFIVKGSERVVLIQEKMRVGRIFLKPDSNGIVSCDITVITDQGSAFIKLPVDKDGVIRLRLALMGKDEKNNEISVGIIQGFQATFSKPGQQFDVDDIIRFIIGFVNPKARHKAIHYLNPSKLYYLNDPDGINHILKLQKKLDSSPDMEIVRGEYVRIKDMFVAQLFPHMGHDQRKKMELLALMVARILEYLSGYRELDDRDNWGNKRLESAGRMMSQLFNVIWKNVIRNINKVVDDAKTKITIETIKRGIKPSIVTDNFVTSFSTINWGVNKSFAKKNVSDILKAEGGSLTRLSHLTRINTPTSNRVKSGNIRSVRMSQLGYICPAETPEGENCGLVKNKSITCYISIDRNEILISERLIGKIVPEADMNNTTICILNGKLLGWCAGKTLRDYFVDLRRSSSIPKDIALVLVESDNIFYIYTDGGRPTRPLLIVDDDGRLVIDKKNLWGAPFIVLLNEGCVEYIDSWEQEFIKLAQTVGDVVYRKLGLDEAYTLLNETKTQLDDAIEMGDEVQITHFRNEIDQTQSVINTIQKNTPYTHSEMDPNALYGVSVNIIPLLNSNQGPRNTYQASMGKQGLGAYHSNVGLRFGTTTKTLAYPNRPMFESQLNAKIGLNAVPAGQNVIVAIMTYTGYNQEDAVIFNQGSLDRGLFTMVVYHSYSSIAVKKTKKNEEIFMIPPEITANSNIKVVNRDKKTTVKRYPASRYANLDERGIVREGSMVKEGDVIIGKVRKVADGNGVTYEDISVTVNIGDDGVVDRVYETVNGEGHKLIRVRLRDVRIPQTGDKFASRHAQKATIGLILPEEDMPYTVDGVKPDIIINPHCIPSRMTIGKLIEIIASKVGAFEGTRKNSTAFRNFNIDVLRRSLVQYGYNEWGNETLFSGFSGRRLNAQIFIGPCYYQALRHHVKDKIQARQQGPRTRDTRQPVRGRKRRGAIRWGEMETAAAVSHGAAHVLQERLCTVSDEYITVMCKTCGSIAISDITKSMIPGMGNSCRRCGDAAEFGRCTIPYANKYMIQLLLAAGIQFKFGLIKPGEEAPIPEDFDYQNTELLEVAS